MSDKERDPSSSDRPDARPSSRLQGFDRPEYKEFPNNHTYGGQAAERDRKYGDEAPVEPGASEEFGGSPYYPPAAADRDLEATDAPDAPATRYGRNAPHGDDHTPSDTKQDRTKP